MNLIFYLKEDKERSLSKSYFAMERGIKGEREKGRIWVFQMNGSYTSLPIQSQQTLWTFIETKIEPKLRSFAITYQNSKSKKEKKK